MAILFQDGMHYIYLVYGFTHIPELEDDKMNEVSIPEVSTDEHLASIKNRINELNLLIEKLPLKLDALSEHIKELCITLHEIKR